MGAPLSSKDIELGQSFAIGGFSGLSKCSHGKNLLMVLAVLKSETGSFSMRSNELRMNNSCQQDLNHCGKADEHLRETGSSHQFLWALRSKKLLQQPTSLTCGHIFCKECIPKYMVSVCPTCKARFLSKNLKPAEHIEEMLKKYQEMEATLKVQNSDNGSQLGSFTGESSFISTPQSIQKGNGLLMNKSCQQASPVFEKRVHRLGINSYDALSLKLTREEPPRDSPAVVSTPSKSLTTAVPSQGHVPAVDIEFLPPPPNSGLRANTSCTKDSYPAPCTNPSTCRNKKTERKELAGSSVKRLKLTSSRLPVGLYEDECIFCHSFRRNLEGYGELLCIQKGQVVTEPDSSSKAKVFYAHENCILWAPVIYYEGDQLMNLRSEIQRSAKLMCAKCGLNGAALGCFYEHCPKSYHPPCAYHVDGCRWDTVNYSMLCPDHVSEKLPSDTDPTISDTAANGNGRTSSKRTLKTH